jgi:uncharacterized protein
MLKSIIIRTVDFCSRNALWVILAGVALGVVSGGYAARHFAITTDINQLISPDLPWRHGGRAQADQARRPHPTADDGV